MSPSRPASETAPVRLEGEADPVGALTTAYARGGLVSVLTSGTSGAPRRVVRTAASWVDSFPAVAELTELGPGDRVWVPGPLTATMNLYAVALARSVRAARVDSPEGATHLFVTPTALDVLLNESPSRPIAGVRVVVAGDRLAPSQADRAEARGWRVSHYYGAAQLSFVAWGRDAASLRPFPRVELKAVGGVIWVRSPWVATREILPPGQSPVLRHSDGWATVGDRGELTAAGLLHLTGRPDAVTSAGETVILAEVEEVLRGAAAGPVAVVGLPHEHLGAVVAAVCTDARDLDTLPERARAVLTGAQRPRRWLHRAALPMTPAGKVDRGALARWAADR